jgi:hypothetical protein
MADCADPKLFEILGSELWEDALVDLAIAKCLLVAFKPEPPQLSPYVHRVAPMFPLRVGEFVRIPLCHKGPGARGGEIAQ